MPNGKKHKRHKMATHKGCEALLALPVFRFPLRSQGGMCRIVGKERTMCL